LEPCHLAQLSVSRSPKFVRVPGYSIRQVDPEAKMNSYKPKTSSEVTSEKTEGGVESPTYRGTPRDNEEDSDSDQTVSFEELCSPSSTSGEIQNSVSSPAQPPFEDSILALRPLASSTIPYGYACMYCGVVSNDIYCYTVGCPAKSRR